jgi:hypothetical protein
MGGAPRLSSAFGRQAYCPHTGHGAEPLRA